MLPFHRHGGVAARLLVLTSAGVLAALLAGCATGQDLGSGTTGSIGSPRTYLLSSAEQNWHCDSLENALQARITKIAALTAQAKAESVAVPPTVTQLFSRLFGEPGSDSPALAQITPERVAADAYHDAMGQKGCAHIDIDAKLASLAPPATSAVPAKIPTDGKDQLAHSGH